jgi:hypothetical protein
MAFKEGIFDTLEALSCRWRRNEQDTEFLPLKTWVSLA